MTAAQLGALALGQSSFAISQAGEDGSFYVAIAKNIADGHGITFDGISPTTGVHWGWLFLLAGVFKLIPTSDPETLFRIAGCVYYLLLVAASFTIYRITPIGAVFMLWYLANRGHWYMETHFVLLTLACAIRWPTMLAGFALVLGRTDTVILALLVGRWKMVLGAVLGFAAVCVINYWVDGTFVGVAAQIKSAGFNDWEIIWRASKHLAIYYPMLPFMCLLALFSPDRWFWASLALLAIHILHNSETEGWYLAPVFLTSLLCANRAINNVLIPLWNYGRLVGLPWVRV